MLCALLNRELGFLFRFVLRFLDRSFSRAMGCFFGCFRMRDDRGLPSTQLVSESSRSKPAEAVISENRLSSLFLSAEKKESSCKNVENPFTGSPENDKELKKEAKFLKACGTLVETPAEIRKASEKLKVSPPHSTDSEYSKFHSWLPNTSIKKLQLDAQLDQPPTPVKLCEEWGTASGSSEHTPSSCLSNARNTEEISVDSTDRSGRASANTAVRTYPNQTEKNGDLLSPWQLTTDMQSRKKSVHFECDILSSSGSSASENFSRHMKTSESPGNQSAYKSSPYPTPLKLSDEMQTPGTVFPTPLENSNVKPRVRSQYVHSVYNPVENVSHRKVLEEDDFYSEQHSGELRYSIEQPDNRTPKSESGLKGTSNEKESKAEASLSAWLKPLPSTQEEDSNRFGLVSGKNAHRHRTPGDRPIIGIVAAHWNEDERSNISPKWWDGNGIPNSTNKYKEDQKVSWHATPFEERLEKALSEETFISQRKNMLGKPIAFDENEENDTAISQFQSSTHTKSVVSF
ncbi:Protein JASON [Quillaja saponaria]|uniref:Protein JASON n=1 Tax=Quillaja saponaria TaxID=32244 RepID=A0AAD7LMB1_QUISA|nr:Protein JASON [Quillaja saponaria]